MQYIRQILMSLLALSVVLHVSMAFGRLREWYRWYNQSTISSTARMTRRISLRMIERQICLHIVGIVLETLVIMALLLPWWTL